MSFELSQARNTREPHRSTRASERRAKSACTAAELLAILEPSAEDPPSILAMGFWKTGTPGPVALERAAG